ncbi:YceD family protein [Bacillota bacterium Lsc_1132]
MKWTLSQLQKYRNKDFLIDETVRVDEIEESDPSIRDVSPIHVTGRADIGSTKVTFHLKIEGHLILPCSRTLVDVNYPIHVETTETFLLQVSEYEMEEEEAHQIKGDSIDLMPVIREILLLEVPLQVFSDDVHPEGAAPQSGKDWEVIREEEQSKKIDPRLAGLAKFFNDNETSSDS